jgi:hypothetical protein
MLEVGHFIPEFELRSTQGNLFSSAKITKKQFCIFTRRMEHPLVRLKREAFHLYMKILKPWAFKLLASLLIVSIPM